MTQDNIQQDTQNTNETKEYASLEEAVFDTPMDSGSKDISDIFITGKEETTAEAPVIGQPDANTEVKSEVTPNNDTTRYQYWQSQADKMKQQNTELQGQLQQHQVIQPPVQESAQEEITSESFPPPPIKPVRPAHFAREEAYSDPSSDSAKYLDSVEQWRDDITEYQGLKTQFESSLVQEKIDKIQAEKVENAKRFQARQQIKKQKDEVYNYVTGHHGLSKEDAVNFINTMSRPDSVNIDNLVSLYRLNSGGAPQQGNPTQPSQDFKQMQNAQQVPSPMGVLPSGQSDASNKTMEDKIMDSLIGDFNSKNPWK